MVGRGRGMTRGMDSHAMCAVPPQSSRTRGGRAVRIGCAATIALMVLLLLLYVGAVERRQAWREGQRDEIYEAVFRHQIRYLDRHLSPRPTRYYLAVSLGDPSDEFMRRFRDLGSRVESVAVARKFCRGLGSGRDAADREWRKVQERPEQAGVLISLDSDEKINPMSWSPDSTLAELFGFWGRDGVQDSCRSYDVRRRNGVWVVARDTPAG